MRLSELRRELLSRTEAVEARIIISLATGLDDIHQITESGKEITEEEKEKAFSLLEKRLSGVPMAYITGEKEFYGHVFKVNHATLIPRPDTETIVERALEIARTIKNPKILDLCTGSGAIGTSIAYELSIPVSLSDISHDALVIAEENYRNICGNSPDAREGSLFEPWKGERFDMIVTNPPYLTDKWYEETDKDVKAEPISAFIGGGEDGLDLIREIINKSPEFLSDNGYLLIECDYRQIALCDNLLRISGFSSIGVDKDLAGKERVIYGRLSE